MLVVRAYASTAESFISVFEYEPINEEETPQATNFRQVFNQLGSLLQIASFKVLRLRITIWTQPCVFKAKDHQR
jgi:hypothetical protein